MGVSENPLISLFQAFQNISNCIQTQISSLTGIAINPSPPTSNDKQLSSLLSFSSSSSDLSTQQYPEHPTRQQKKDVKELMAILSRMYPCKECADHFKEVLRSNPVQAGSQSEFSQWLCHVHNVVNRSLGKPVFLCERVDARWGKLDCEQRLCDLHGSTDFGGGIL
ncbi:FAD-linked sulfhydryl oxidase ERV1 isoform X2 [Amaranthus tricolor]|uniref:FAD-linked sulfhydryl oxidase ERV1 isoform X2 n=1 Tax=Amaranthus tricolor TaxID=29722 RepID=UPI0025906177|nr:FAD-linked sulfhydryl oxidase ERV1 isoform X2 [Amaranthus tricolor]